MVLFLLYFSFLLRLPDYFHIHQAIVRNQPDEAKVLLKDYLDKAEDQEKAKRNLLASLRGRRPGDMGEDRLSKLRAHLGPEKWAKFDAAQKRYEDAVDALGLAPQPQGGGAPPPPPPPLP